MTELKKHKAPTLFNENYVNTPLNTLKRTKNDFIDRKTVWRIAIFSFLLGTLISLFLLWFSYKQVLNSEAMQNKNPVQQSISTENHVQQDRLSNDNAKNENGMNNKAQNSTSLTPAKPDDLDIQTKLNITVADTGTDKNNSETITNSHSTIKPDNYSGGHPNNHSNNHLNNHQNTQSKSLLKAKVLNPNINKLADAKPETKLKPLNKPTTSNADNTNKQAKSTNKRNNIAKPKVDVIEQWINTHLKTQADHNPFRVLEQDNSSIQTENKKNSKDKSKKNAD